MIDVNKIYNMDCLEGMKQIDDNSIDMILCDLPYGVTARNKWDEIIPFDELWEQYERIIKDRGMMCFTATQPFATKLINSNPKLFKYDLIWDKSMPTGFLNANRMPLRKHELILCFYKNTPIYNPIMRIGKKRKKGGKLYSVSNCYGNIKQPAPLVEYDKYYPTSIIKFQNANQKKKTHPTEKPLKLFEYLIKTYTNKGDVVLDNCMGSGTTAVACKQTGRNYIGFEINKKYYDVAVQRVSNTTSLQEWLE